MQTNEREGQSWEDVDVGGQPLGDLVEQLPPPATLIDATAGRLMDDAHTIESLRRERRRRDLALELVPDKPDAERVSTLQRRLLGAREAMTLLGLQRDIVVPEADDDDDAVEKPRRAWHSAKSKVHHDHPDCNTGNNIETENRRPGTGDRPLCAECARLDKARPH